VASINHEQQTLGRLLDSVLTADVIAGINPSWASNVLGKYFAAWPFVEYGQFLAFCYVVREALAETLTFAYAFEASDKLRYSQNIVIALLELQGKRSGFSDQAARPAWESDPVLVPLREMLEQIYASNDWVETVVAIDLVLEPLIGTLVKQEFFALNAPHNGDPVLPLILGSERADAKRHLESAVALATHVLADPQHGAANRKQLAAWREKWFAKADRAANALQGLFAIDGISVRQGFEPSLTKARQARTAAWASLNI
jgi:methane monooxygenase component A beta chain/propane monooxygenase small subunit